MTVVFSRLLNSSSAKCVSPASCLTLNRCIWTSSALKAPEQPAEIRNKFLRPVEGVAIDIGTREVVGFGRSGMPIYVDSKGMPFPAIRFREVDARIAELREKEKGHWGNLTIAEKKELYRASFCLTFAEINAATPDYLYVISGVLFAIAFGLWCVMAIHEYVLRPCPRYRKDPDHIKECFDYMVKCNVAPISGWTSNYDYDKEEWKLD